jgi:hypothetical protein
MKPLKINIGDTYNRLTTKAIVRINGKKYFVCDCICGNEKNVIPNNLVKGRVKSCGCLNTEVRKITMSKNMKKHGLTHTPEYNSWAAIIQRCTNKRNAAFKNYGGRGITVCDRWMTSFENFIADMGLKPSQTHSIDRINNDVGYSPENCRWATDREQIANRRITKRYQFNGNLLTINEISEIIGVKPGTIKQRLVYGWPENKAFKNHSRNS